MRPAPPPRTLITHADAAIGEFLVATEDSASLPCGAEWADVIHPWWRFNFDDAEDELNKGRLVALPCAAEGRAAAEVALTSEFQCAIQTHHDERRELLWIRQTIRKTDTTDDHDAPATVAAHSRTVEEDDQYIENVVRDFRVATPDRVPFDKRRWTAVKNALVAADWETAEFAMRRGQVVALACEPEERATVEAIVLYELAIGDALYACYHDGLLWIRKLDSDTGPTGETD